MSENTKNHTLSGLLFDLYAYDRRLEAELEYEVSREVPSVVSEKATRHELEELTEFTAGDYSNLLLFARGPVEFRHSESRFRPDLDAIVINALGVAEDRVRQRHIDSGTPYEKSGAWPCAARWVSRKLGADPKAIQTKLAAICRDLADERKVTLHATRDPENREIEVAWAEAMRGGRPPTSFKDINPFDTPQNVDELERLICEQWPEEAKQLGWMAVKTEQPKRPSNEAFQAYHVYKLAGLTQVDVATKMHTNQGQVSRWVNEVEVFADAGGTVPKLSIDRPQITPTDPAKLEMGKRLDHRRPKPSDSSTD